jgi:hypothetical protein
MAQQTEGEVVASVKKVARAFAPEMDSLSADTSGSKKKKQKTAFPPRAADGLGWDPHSNGNHDNCDACGEGGSLICCDSCPNSFHIVCLDPPLRKVPDGNWYCNACLAKRGLAPNISLGGNILDPLLARLPALNPRAFLLPDSLRPRQDKLFFFFLSFLPRSRFSPSIL